jgi:beta-lactamase superfamily II metal-dependent hydrolase
MPVPKIHFFNVRKGDCFILERKSGRLTVLDISCGNLSKTDTLIAQLEQAEERRKGNFNMCKTPTNPLDYLSEKGFTKIWRFILTHPDMDHMDGIKNLFSRFTVYNFWDCGIRKEKPDFKEYRQYSEEDWDLYNNLINGRVDRTKVISPRAGDKGKYWNQDDGEDEGNGDYISIISPSPELLDAANESGDVHQASYVIVYRSSAGNVIFSGDSNSTTWQYILREHKGLVSDAAVLFAPHHGRKKDQDFSYLKVVKPRITFFGCAPSVNLAYSAWGNRKLLYFTNNQCGNAHIYPEGKLVKVFIENPRFAKGHTRDGSYQRDGYWYLCTV